MRKPPGFSIGGTWGQWRSRGEKKQELEDPEIVFPTKCSSHLLNTTEEGAIALKALVFLGFAINIRFQLLIRMVDKGKRRV